MLVQKNQPCNSPTELTWMLPTDCKGSFGCPWLLLLLLRRKKHKCGKLPQAATTQCLFTAMLLMLAAAAPVSAASAVLLPAACCRLAAAATAVVLTMAPVSGLMHTIEPSLDPTYTPCGHKAECVRTQFSRHVCQNTILPQGFERSAIGTRHKEIFAWAGRQVLSSLKPLPSAADGCCWCVGAFPLLRYHNQAQAHLRRPCVTCGLAGHRQLQGC